MVLQKWQIKRLKAKQAILRLRLASESAEKASIRRLKAQRMATRKSTLDKEDNGREEV
jgi:hypothetical protein